MSMLRLGIHVLIQLSRTRQLMHSTPQRIEIPGHHREVMSISFQLAKCLTPSHDRPELGKIVDVVFLIRLRQWESKWAQFTIEIRSHVPLAIPRDLIQILEGHHSITSPNLRFCIQSSN